MANAGSNSPESIGRSTVKPPGAALLVLALTPFCAKAAVLLLGSQGYGLQSIYKLFQLAVPCWWRYRWHGARGLRVLWPIDESLPAVRTIAVAVGTAAMLGGLGIVAAVWILPHVAIDPAQLRAGFDSRFAVGPAGALFVVAFLSLLNSGLEELHFRAWLDRELSIRYGAAVGIAGSAGAFGAMHILIFLGMPGLPGIAVLLVPCALAAAGAAWSLIMRQPGGIHATWLSHGLTDALLLGWGLYWLGYV